MEQTEGWWGTNDPIIFAVFIGLVLLVHFVPSFIAFSREHTRRKLILVLNLLTGWTMIGWVVLLVWSLKGNREKGLLPV